MFLNWNTDGGGGKVGRCALLEQRAVSFQFKAVLLICKVQLASSFSVWPHDKYNEMWQEEQRWVKVKIPV